METIYNTLTTSIDIQEFINDGGKIYITYNSVSKVSDMYDITNIVEIKCVFPSCMENGYTACVTFMNKFFRFALFKCAMPVKVINAQGNVTIEFCSKNDALETMENEFSIIKELNTIVEKANNMIDYFESRINILNARKVIFEVLSSVKHITDRFIDSLRNDNEMCEHFSKDAIYFTTWHANSEIRQQLKDEKTQLTEYFSDKTYEETLKYYNGELEKYQRYIS